MYRFLPLLCLVLGGCCEMDDACLRAEEHREKLRLHFRGQRMGDVSTLIAETRAISACLKRTGNEKEANEFDSYIDVLTYGNRTIDESINDVMKLVQKNSGSEDPCSCD